MQSSYQTIAANYLIFRNYDDLLGAVRPLSPAADAKTPPPPPHTPTARLRPGSHPADDWTGSDAPFRVKSVRGLVSSEKAGINRPAPKTFSPLF